MGRPTNCDRLWKLWYAILVTGIHVFLTYNAVRQYLEYKAQSYDPMYGGEWPEAPMNFYIAMLLISLALLPMFLYAAVIKVGNFSNDDVIIGKDTDNLKIALLESSDQAQGRVLWQRLRRHLLPFSCYLHVISAFALLLPKPTLLAEQIKNEALPKHTVWQSDLDFLFRPDLNHPNSYPQPDPVYQINLAMCPEMGNFLLALTILTVRFPNTFWYSSRPFALAFSFLLFCSGVHLLFDFSAFSVLYKLGQNPGLQPDEFREFYPALLGPWVCLGLHAIGFVILLILQITIYEYGQSQFLHSLRKYRQYFNSGNNISISPSEVGSDNESGCPVVVLGACTNKSNKNGCCLRFWPNIASICLLGLLLAVRAPLTWLYIQMYTASKDSLLLTASIVNILYLTVWLLIWFCFTVKTSWRFQVNVPVQTISQITQEKLEPPEAIYGCYHADQTMSHSSNSSDVMRFPGGGGGVNIGGGGTDCCSESSKTSSSVRGGSNYVYLQSNLPTIPTISEHMDGAASDASYETPPNRMPPGTMMAGDPSSVQLLHGNANSITNGLMQRRSSKQGDPTYATLASIAAATAGMITHPMHMSSNPDDFDDGSGNGTLNRNSRTRRSGNRVTFKDHHDTIPGSPAGSQQSSNMPSIDSGIGGFMGTGLQINQFNPKLTTSGNGNYEDYQMFRNMFAQQMPPPPPQQPTGGPYRDIYAGAPRAIIDGDFMKVPDILMNEQGTPTGSTDAQNGMQMSAEFNEQMGLRSPYEGSLSCRPNSRNGGGDHEMSYSLEPQPDIADQSLCSQV